MSPEIARLKKIEQQILANPLTAVVYLQIATKKSKQIFLHPNRPQRYLLKHMAKYNRIYCLKFRQAGFSTIIQGVNFIRTALYPNVDSVLVSHEKDSTRRLLKTTQSYLSWMPQSFPPSLLPEIGSHGRQAQNEIFFSKLNSSIFIGTAGSDAFGRGSKINNLHLSELSSYKGQNVPELIAGLEEAVPIDGTITIETTPRGVGNIAHQYWTDDTNGFFKLFIPWYMMEEYSLTEPEFAALTLDKMAYPAQDNLKQEEKDVIRAALLDYGLVVTLGQIAFRRWKIATRGRFFYQEYPEDPISCFIIDASNIFDSQKLYELVLTIDDNPVEMMMDNKLRIYRWPEKNRSYVIGVDTSGGDINSDFSYAFVMDAETCEQVASFHIRLPDFALAEKLVIIARFYNSALVAVERNNHGASVLNSLTHKEGYDNLYYAEDKQADWHTNGKTKPLMLTGSDGLSPAIEKGYMKIHEKELLGECLTMEYKPGIRQEGMAARDGCYDDRSMGAAIAYQARVNAMVVRNGAGERIMVA